MVCKKYHAEHAAYGGASQEFHMRAETHVVVLENQLADVRMRHGILLEAAKKAMKELNNCVCAAIVKDELEIAIALSAGYGMEAGKKKIELNGWSPIQWIKTVTFQDGIFGRYFIDRCDQPDGTYLWAVRDHVSSVMSHKGEWEYEPSPSNRDDDFYKRFRFSSPEEASAAFDLWVKKEKS